MKSTPISYLLFVAAALVAGCSRGKPTPPPDVVQAGEARSVFVRNTIEAPMTFQIDINGEPYETIILQPGQSVFYYERLPVGMPRAQVKDYRTSGKITDNFGRSYKNKNIDYSLDLGKSDVFPYHPTGVQNGTNTPNYNVSLDMTEWLTEIDAVARKVENFESIEVYVSPVEGSEPRVEKAPG